MKLEENVTHKMLKILRFFRRERRSVDVNDESTEEGKGLTLFQHLAAKSFSVRLYFPFLLLTEVVSVRVVFVTSFHSLFSLLTHRFFRDSTLISCRVSFHYFAQQLNIRTY